LNSVLGDSAIGTCVNCLVELRGTEAFRNYVIETGRSESGKALMLTKGCLMPPFVFTIKGNRS